MQETTSMRTLAWDEDALRKSLVALVEGEPDTIANLANLAAGIYEAIPGLNWAGFYLMRGGELVLGPFQGRPACIRIAVGSGVCGTAVAEGVRQVVPDVHAFPGHIACDPRSRSELVIPMRDGEGRIVAVLDLDSDQPANFSDADGVALERIVEAVTPHLTWRDVLPAS